MVMRAAASALPDTTASVEQFTREHKHFRAKFAVMIAAERLWPESKWVIREIGFSLLRQLQNHSQREIRLATACYLALGREGSSELRRLSIDHSAECRVLRRVNQVFVTPPDEKPDCLACLIRQSSEQCGHQINKQEQQLFPLLECVLRIQRPDPRLEAALDSAMTGSQAVERFPALREVFERLRVDIGLEGYYSIEEIASRRGLRSRRLLKELEEGIGAR